MEAEKTREELVEALERYFEAYYDVNKASEDAAPLRLRCDLHVNNQKYFLFKKNVMWEANCHEYVYIFSVPKPLCKQILSDCFFRFCVFARDARHISAPSFLASIIHSYSIPFSFNLATTAIISLTW